jgi:stringent starvation protein B
MPNVKAQSSNEMPNQVRHDHDVILNLALNRVQGLRFQNLILDFDITFDIWILKFMPFFLLFSKQDRLPL